MSISQSDYAAMQMRLARNKKPKYETNSPELRGNPIVQKHQDDCSQQADNRPAKAKNHGANNPKFRVAVTLLVGDNRDRDGDGAYSTIQDCLISAVGRLLKVDRIALRRMAKSVERSGGV